MHHAASVVGGHGRVDLMEHTVQRADDFPGEYNDGGMLTTIEY